MRKGKVKSVEIEEPSIHRAARISFSFEFLHDTSYADCKDGAFFVRFLQRLKKLCSLTWNEIDKSDRHSFGYEKIPANRLKKNIHLTMDVNHLLAFRASGDNHVFLGFREGSVFNVVFIESNFGDIYNHG